MFFPYLLRVSGGGSPAALDVIIRNELYSACKAISGVLGINGDLCYRAVFSFCFIKETSLFLSCEFLDAIT